MMRPHWSWRPTWRRAYSAMSRAAARASTANTWSIVRAVGSDWARPNRSVAAGANESAIHPDALLTRICTGPSSPSAASNSRGTARRVGQVGLDRGRPATCGPDRLDDEVGPRHPGGPVRGRERRVVESALALVAVVRAQHRDPPCRQGLGHRGADAVVRPRHERDPGLGGRSAHDAAPCGPGLRVTRCPVRCPPRSFSAGPTGGRAPLRLRRRNGGRARRPARAGRSRPRLARPGSTPCPRRRRR